jgi:hypothetical protein
MLEWCDEPGPDLAVPVIATARPQLDDHSRDPVVLRKIDPHDAVL